MSIEETTWAGDGVGRASSVQEFIERLLHSITLGSAGGDMANRMDVPLLVRRLSSLQQRGPV